MATKAKTAKKTISKIETDELERLKYTIQVNDKIISNLRDSNAQLQREVNKLEDELAALKHKANTRHWLMRKLGL